MWTWGIKEETMDELRAAFASDDKQAKSIHIGIFDGNPYYIAMTGLKYNDWHLVVYLKADRAFAHSQHIVYSTSGQHRSPDYCGYPCIRDHYPVC